MERIDNGNECRKALPRDISRFKKLYPNGRAVIKDDAPTTLAYISTAELVNEAVEASCGFQKAHTALVGSTDCMGISAA